MNVHNTYKKNASIWEGTYKTHEETCPICKSKIFMTVPSMEWGYTLRKRNGCVDVFCSYTCLRVREKENAERYNAGLSVQGYKRHKIMLDDEV